MKRHLLPLFLLAAAGTAQAQTKIGLNPTVIDPSSLLELENPNKALYLNRAALTSTTDITTIPNPKAGMVVYNTNPAITGATADSTGLYYFTGTFWRPTGNSTGTGPTGSWLVTGNSGLIDAVNFLGTKDAVPLNFRVNNDKAGRIEFNIATGNVSYGYKSQSIVVPVPNGDGSFNTSVGNYTLQVNTTGSHNAALGYDALGANTTGDSNAAFGFGALQVNTVGFNNSAFGAYSLNKNISGKFNTAVGYEALHMNVIDSGHTAVGAYALYNNNGGKANTATGFGAMFVNVNGRGNTANGFAALRMGISSNFNTAMGFYAGANSGATGTGGSSNVFIGYQADTSNTTGLANTVVGYQAGINNTGSRNTFVGHNAQGTVANLTYSGSFGSEAVVSVNNGLVLGATDAGSATNNSVNPAPGAFNSSYVGINVTDPTQRIDFRNGHIRNRQDNLPMVGSPLPAGNGVTAASVAAGSSDVKGRINTVGFNNSNGFTSVRVDFAYLATTPPIVNITPANESASTTAYFVTSDNAGFTLSFRNVFSGSNASGPTASFNYMVIE